MKFFSFPSSTSSYYYKEVRTLLRNFLMSHGIVVTTGTGTRATTPKEIDWNQYTSNIVTTSMSTRNSRGCSHNHQMDDQEYRSGGGGGGVVVGVQQQEQHEQQPMFWSLSDFPENSSSQNNFHNHHYLDCRNLHVQQHQQQLLYQQNSCECIFPTMNPTTSTTIFLKCLQFMKRIIIKVGRYHLTYLPIYGWFITVVLAIYIGIYVGRRIEKRKQNQQREKTNDSVLLRKDHKINHEQRIIKSNQQQQQQGWFSFLPTLLSIWYHCFFVFYSWEKELISFLTRSNNSNDNSMNDTNVTTTTTTSINRKQKKNSYHDTSTDIINETMDHDHDHDQDDSTKKWNQIFQSMEASSFVIDDHNNNNTSSLLSVHEKKIDNKTFTQEQQPLEQNHDQELDTASSAEKGVALNCMTQDGYDRDESENDTTDNTTTIADARRHLLCTTNRDTTYESYKTIPDVNMLPKHIAVIMDGNRRYGKEKYDNKNNNNIDGGGSSTSTHYGHVEGSKKLLQFIKWCISEKIHILTVYALSTENWNRNTHEIYNLMLLIEQYCEEIRIDAISKKNIVVNILSSDPSYIPSHIQTILTKLQNDTASNATYDPSTTTTSDKNQHQQQQQSTSNHHCLQLNICLSYSGQNEIIHACQQVAKDYKMGIITSLNDITNQTFTKKLLFHNTTQCQIPIPTTSTDGATGSSSKSSTQHWQFRDDESTINSPDLLIRTSGEIRMSNFLLYQCAYTELYFITKYWPEITKDDFLAILHNYVHVRKRRFGK